MPTPEEVKNVLDEVLVPDVKRSLIKMNLVRDVSVANGKVDITIATAALMKTAQEQLKESVKEQVAGLDGVKDVAINFADIKPKELNKIKHVIAIMSGKGGVGKSLVASLAAVALQREGYDVGILDADITGPSIPMMFGINSRPAMSESGLMPVPTRSGIEVMSINLLLQSDDDAVIWRGPLIGHAITQFWEEVLWGSLDYLIVDLPPGTADAPLTVLQTIPISGIIIVFTPQDLTAMVVRKAVNMARKMGKSILGVVENMSYLHVAEIDKKIELFGKSRGEEMSRSAEAPLLGQLPIDPELAKLGDEGNIEQYNSSMYNAFAQNLIKNIPKQKE
ncbi:MAG: Mrp/NBP35 family ATP-binding protein [Dehalococcoidales bacterium]|nr:Mrp/NBP35 family ATP-binding protein [Dehalococcoidales bacterium]